MTLSVYTKVGTVALLRYIYYTYLYFLVFFIFFGLLFTFCMYNIARLL